MRIRIIRSIEEKIIIWGKYKKKNNELVERIMVRWSNLKDEIKKMSEDEKKKKKKKMKNQNQIKYWKLLKKFLNLIKIIRKQQG